MGLLDGKVALVTGGGRGIGRGIAVSLAAQGAKVVINDLGAGLSGDGLDAKPAQEVLSTIEKQGGAAAINGGSVASYADAQAMVEQALDTFGGLDIVVHAAGVLRDRMIFNMTEEEWDVVVAVHLKGFFNVLRPATALMRQQKRGRIIALASGSAYGDPGQPNYSAAKAGIIGLSFSTANAMAKYGVTSNVVLPTGTTRMIDSKPESAKIFEETGKWPSEHAKGTEKDPDNVAPLVTFLASDRAAAVNGQVFHSLRYGYTLIEPPRTLARLEGDTAWTPEELADAFDRNMAPGMRPRPAMPFGRDVDNLAGDDWMQIGNGRRYWTRPDQNSSRMMTGPRNAAIVGVAESDEIGEVPNKSTLQLQGEAALNALDDAGLSLSDVEGLFTAGFRTTEVAEYLGIQPRYFDGTHVGGSSFVVHLGHAAAAIASGRIDVALIVHGERALAPGPARIGQQPPQGMEGQFEAPYGPPGAPGSYAMACARHMHQYGTTSDQLAEIAVAARKWAQLNPRAYKRDPLTIDDVLSSPLVTWPFRRFDCCLVTDAAGAVVVTSLERARDLKKPVRVIGWGEGHDHQIISQMPDLTSGPGRISGPDAFAMAGIRHDDIDVAQIYDSFTYTVLTSLEDIGFCKKGEGGAFVSGGRIAPGGSFPLNTSGGGLSYTHPGMFGIFTIIECARQLRGDFHGQGLRQVADAKIGLVHGTGGKLSATGTAILAAD